MAVHQHKFYNTPLIGDLTNPKMTYDIQYLESMDLHVVQTSGDMTGYGFVSMAEALLNHPEWLPNKNVLFDHRDLNFKKASIKDIERIRSFHKKNENRIGSGKSAIVVKSGLSSEWHKLWSRGEKIQTGNIVQVFENYDKAIHWIRK